ncbi:MAG TPA: hypothetical protein PLT25_07575, partial [Acidocella sp.]|nr:hypothetical protein [Acidocella sp.]
VTTRISRFLRNGIFQTILRDTPRPGRQYSGNDLYLCVNRPCEGSFLFARASDISEALFTASQLVG